MAELFKGKPVADALNEKMKADISNLNEKGVIPTLAIVRVGEREDGLSYERGAVKRCAAVGVQVKHLVFPLDIDQEVLMNAIHELNKDDSVHGVLIFRPLPKTLDEEAVRKALSPAKDVDGITDGSLTGVFTNTAEGFAPCTAQACMEILDHYGVECKGKRAVVIGRSLVVGRPAALMLMHKNATVTVCHTKTTDMPSVTQEADIVIVAAGKMETIGKEYFKAGQIVIDVGINWNDEKGKLCGDVKFDEVETIVSAITPVPGGVGSVTTAVLVSHVVEAAKRSLPA
jgi:methylenetetrahydrofolate dehydrogenase (NADP+)/methenyltetrahydrofolate cyclohydrolase